MAVTFPVAVVVRAVDKLTAPMRLMRREISRVLKPIDEMRGKFKRFGDAAGLPKLMKGVSGLSSALGGLWQSAKQSVFWIGGIAVAATAAGFALVKSFAGAAEEIQNTAQKLGVGVEVLQGWRHAANLNHIENEALEKGVLSLARAFDKARHGGKAQLELFRRIGISEEQLRTFKSLEQLLPAVADGLGGVRNATARAAIVQGLFSKVGAQLIPMLMAGSAGLAEMTAEARKLGIVLDASTIKAAAELDDEIDRLEASFLGVRNAIASQLVPELLPLIKRFREWITENLPRIRALARAIADRLPGAIESVTKAFAKLWGQSKPVRDVLGQLFELLGPLGVAIVVVAGILIATLGPAILSTVAALATLSAALVSTPAGWVVLALVALAAALAAATAAVIYLYLHWDEVKKRFPKVAAIIESLAKVSLALLTQKLKEVGVLIEYVANRLLAFPEQLATIWSLAGDVIKNVFGGAWDWIEARFNEGVAFVAGKVAQVTSILPDWLKSKLGLDATVQQAPPTTSSAAQSPAAIAVKSEAAVRVDFNNLPRDARVTPTRQSGVDLDLNLGYQNIGP